MIQTKKVKALSEAELKKVFGGFGDEVSLEDSCDANGTNCASCKSGADSTDCTSEAASGGTTTDTE